MKLFRRAVSGLLSLAMTGSICTAALPAVAAAEPASAVSQAQGAISLTLAFTLPQRVEEIREREIQLRLTGQGKDVIFPLSSSQTISRDGVTAQVEELNARGTALTTEVRLGYYQVELTGLDKGDYTLAVTGRGYTQCVAEVTLADYAQHVVMNTAGGTFALGDVNGDGAVTTADLDDLVEHLGATTAGELDIYDLDGDGFVDVADLSYVNKNEGISGEPQVYDTVALVSATVEGAALEVQGGSLSDLFVGGSTVTVAPAEKGEDLSIPITLEKPTEMSEISITTPAAGGTIQAGTALVVLEDNSTMEVPFDVTAPAGAYALGRTAGQTVISIDLGKKVAVKKVTITVTKVDGQTGDKPEFAAVTQIEFLKDIVSQEIANDSQVKHLAATAGDETVTLAWDSVNNVTGYEVRYGTDKSQLNSSVTVNTNKAVVDGLKNNQTYYFQVTAVNGDWRGTPSGALSAVPVPDSAPGAPSNILVESADTALRVSWGSTKNATFYRVFYRVKGAAAYTQWGGDIASTGAVITGLTNGTEYEVAVKVGNVKGVGPYSAVALGTPQKEGFTMPQLPADGRIDNSAVTSVVMADSSNVNRDLCPNFNVSEDLTDNDPNTYWVAATWWNNSAITYTFDTTHNMNYLLLVPYLDAAYRNRIDNYTVTLKGEDGTVLATYYRSGVNITADNYYILTFPETKGVKSLTLALGEKTGGPQVSVSEVAFYDSDTLADEIAALFADDAFTTLRGGVDADRISALESRLTALSSYYLDVSRLKDELTLARALLDSDSSALGLMKNDFQSRSGSAAADQAAGQTASALQPLGITARAGATVAIYADLPGDQPVYVVPTQFYGESGVWQGSPIRLNPGRNYITVEKIGSLSDTRGGMLYLTYDGADPQAIKLQIRVLDNAWEMPVLELSGWYTMNETQRKDAIRAYVKELETYVSGLSASNWKTDIRNATEISIPSVLLSLPADQVLVGLKGVGNDENAMVEVMYQNVLAWEEELFIANQVQGIIDADTALAGYTYPMTTRQNIRYMRMFAGAFMYAAGNHVGVEYGSTAALVQGKPTAVTGAGQENGLFGWGIAHEIGHNMDKLGKAECTNNIYSLALQAWDGASMTLDTRLTTDGRWEDIFNKVAQARPGAANNVFVQLGMYWQLHLAYDGAETPLAFFNQFFKLWKSGLYSGYSYDERVALIASKVADRDLTEFFTRWGMTLGDEVQTILEGYTPETRAIWYLNDASRNDRLKGGVAASGAASVTAAVEESKVTLTISHTDSARILGYEIRRNGKAIGFTTGATYVDDLGAANNLAYTYSVVPVDKLGNLGAEAKVNEVRVAYDKTIDAGLYDLKRSGETVTITMKSGACLPVTGIKVTGAGLSGDYTVKVKADAQAEVWTTAKTGTLSGSSLVAYFTKPGAEADDTRIWTYDAAVLELTGIPEDAEVALLDYPGDRVDFHEEAAVGVLSEDYRYGDGADEVIKAGTLVILGTYRGDPVYNTVEIEAVYNTTAEAGEVTSITRPMNGYGLLFAEIPTDGAVSDTSDGFFLFVPDLEAEKTLNQTSGVTDSYPIEIRANFYRTDDPDSSDSRRLTSQTLWLGFPDGGDEEAPVALPEIVLTGSGS